MWNVMMWVMLVMAVTTGLSTGLDASTAAEASIDVDERSPEYDEPPESASADYVRAFTDRLVEVAMITTDAVAGWAYANQWWLGWGPIPLLLGGAGTVAGIVPVLWLLAKEYKRVTQLAHGGAP